MCSASEEDFKQVRDEDIVPTRLYLCHAQCRPSSTTPQFNTSWLLEDSCLTVPFIDSEEETQITIQEHIACEGRYVPVCPYQDNACIFYMKQYEKCFKNEQNVGGYECDKCQAYL